VDDAGLLERARRGDAEAFSLLFARCQGPIYRYAAHMCGREAADDVVQETFLAVLRGTGRYDAARGGALGYLFGIARHVVLQRLGSRWTAADPLEHDRAATIECDEPTALERLTRSEAIDAVRCAIAALPPAYREAIVLCELQEMSYEDAAAIAQCPVGTIRSRLHRARALLAAKLGAGQAAGGCRRQRP
jgi:RNA polymerase sigma-70 factor (ECF subfamily)